MTVEMRGKPVADSLTDALGPRVRGLRDEGCLPTLAIVTVGEEPDQLAYGRAAARRCEGLGIDVTDISLAADTPQAMVEEVLMDLGRDPEVHGILVMRPLPAHLDEAALASKIPPAKDVDGMTVQSMAGVYGGDPRAFAPCTPEAVIRLLDHYGYHVRGRRAVVIGRSLVVGKPLAMLLTSADATVTLAHSATIDLKGLCRRADLVVSAMGRAGAVTAEMVSPGACVVDVGINEGPDGALLGDVAYDSVAPLCSFITPVPLGVGSVTTAVLASHVVEAAERATREGMTTL